MTRDINLAKAALLNQSSRDWWQGIYKGTVYRQSRGEIVHGDALHFMESLRDSCADIVFLDPPFNLGKRYGKNGSQKWLRLLRQGMAFYKWSLADPITPHRVDTPDNQNKPHPVLIRQASSVA